MNELKIIYKDTIFESGDRVTCFIGNIQIKDAKIHIQSVLRHGSGANLSNHIRGFICQNMANGIKSDNTHGYKFSWKFLINRGETTDSVINLKNITIKDELIKSISGVIG